MKLEELRKLAEARTKGEWKPAEYSTMDGIGSFTYVEGGTHKDYWSGVRSIVRYGKKEDREFIAAAANHFDKLLDVVEAAPRKCICGVSYYDGYNGPMSHTDGCRNLKKALEALENE
jgi:hypothetical protein